MLSAKGPGRLLSTGYPTRMLLVVSLGWATIQCGRFVLPALEPAVESSLGISEAGFGLAFTAFGLLYAAVQLPSGAYSDTLSRATLILPGLLALVGSFVLLGLTTSVVLFWIALLLFGLCKGLYTPPSRALVGDLFTARRGRALGIYSAGTDVGGLIGSAGLATVILSTAALTWQTAFVPLVVVGLLVTVLFVVWNRDPYEPRHVPMETGATLRRLVATPAQRNLLVAYALFFFVVGGLLAFLPAYLVDEMNFTESQAALDYALLFVVGLVIKPLAGELSDRFSRLGVSIATLVVSAVGLAALLLVESLPGVALATILLAVGYKTQFPITDAVILDAAPSGNLGADLGAARAVFLGANSVGPGFVGVVAFLDSFVTAFWALAGGLLLSAGILALEYRRQ